MAAGLPALGLTSKPATPYLGGRRQSLVLLGRYLYDAPGTYALATGKAVLAKCWSWGEGGGGAGYSTTFSRGGYGGGGGAFAYDDCSLVPNQQIDTVIGTGGTQGAADSAGGNGSGTTKVSIAGRTIVQPAAGGGGQTFGVGAGGTAAASTGKVKRDGGNGGSAGTNGALAPAGPGLGSTDGQPGGGCGGDTDQATPYTPQTHTAATGGTSTVAPQKAPWGCGAGGGSSGANKGGFGGDGQVIVELWGYA